MKYFWEQFKAKDQTELTFVFQDNFFIELLEPLDIYSEIKAKDVTAGLNDAFKNNSLEDLDVKRKLVLHISEGPTKNCINFNTDNLKATTSTTVHVSLNPTSEYQGGNHCFYVSNKIQTLNNRPVGSLLVYSDKIVHGVTTLHSGLKLNLLLINESNKCYDVNVHLIQRAEIESFIEKFVTEYQFDYTLLQKDLSLL